MRDLLRLLQLFRPYRAWLLLGILLSFITLLANVALLALSGWFITAMAVAGAAGLSMNYFTPAALIRAAAIVRTGGRYAERLVTHEATLRLLAELRVWFYRKIEPLAPAGLEAYRSGDLLSRIRADIDTLDNVYLRLVVPAAVAVLAVLVFTGFLLWYRPVLALVEDLLLLVAGIAVPWLVHRLGHSAGRQKVEAAAQLRTALVTDLQGMGELLIYGAADRHASHIQVLTRGLAGQQRTLNSLNGLSQGALSLCTNLAMWSMIVLAVPMVSSQTLTPAELAMLAFLALASFEAVAPLPLAMQTWGESLAAARRIFGVADRAPVVSEPCEPLAVPRAFTCRYENVRFRYRASGPDVLQDVSFELPAGHKLAVMGPTGCGKSTLANLLLRFREPTGGSILLNGRPLEQYGGEAVRQRITLVPQHTHLFNTTIRDNLLLARPDADQFAVEQACKTALIHDFVVAQPEGYDTMVGETGVRLSGGQARRVAIARALLRDASMLILDEPTEGIDPETARRIMANIFAYVEAHRQSLLLITHQPHGLQQVDQILVMAGGRVMESGSPRELMAAGGYFRRVAVPDARSA